MLEHEGLRAGSSLSPAEGTAFSKPEVHRPGGKRTVRLTSHPFHQGLLLRSHSPEHWALGVRALTGGICWPCSHCQRVPLFTLLFLQPTPQAWSAILPILPSSRASAWVLSPRRPNTQRRETHPKSQASSPASPPLLTRTRPLPGCSWGKPLAWAGEHANLNVNYMQMQGLPLSSRHHHPPHLCCLWLTPLRPGAPGNTRCSGLRKPLGWGLSSQLLKCPLNEILTEGRRSQPGALPRKTKRSLNTHPPFNSPTKIILHQARGAHWSLGTKHGFPEAVEKVRGLEVRTPLSKAKSPPDAGADPHPVSGGSQPLCWGLASLAKHL